MEENITYQSHDVLFKILSDMYRDTALDMYGLEELNLPKIKTILPNNFPEIKVDEKRSDTVFLLEDESILLLEYESNNKINDNMYKYIDYILRIGSKYYTEDKVVKNIKIVVIYSSNIINAPKQFNTGSLVLDTYPVFMKHYERDIIYEELKEKIKSGNGLNHKDMMNFVLLPYMKTRYNRDIQELIKEDIELAKEVKEEKAQVFIVAGLLTAVNKYIDEDYSKEVRRWLSMTAIERIYQKEKEEALKKQKEEDEREKQEIIKSIDIVTINTKLQTTRKIIIDLLVEKFQFIPNAISKEIESIENLIVLEELLRKIIKINTIEEFKLLLDKAKSIE